VGKITPDQTRLRTKKTLGVVAHGGDPAAEKAAEKRASTLLELTELFLAEHVEPKRKASTAALYREIPHRLVLPEPGKKKADKITASELARLRLSLQDHP